MLLYITVMFDIVYTAQCMKGYVNIWPLQRSQYGRNRWQNILVKLAWFWKCDAQIASETNSMAQTIATRGGWIYGQGLGGVVASLTMSVRWQIANQTAMPSRIKNDMEICTSRHNYSSWPCRCLSKMKKMRYILHNVNTFLLCFIIYVLDINAHDTFLIFLSIAFYVQPQTTQQNAKEPYTYLCVLYKNLNISLYTI